MNQKKSILSTLLWLSCWLTLFTTSNSFATITDSQLMERVQQRYQTMQSLQFSFLQESGGSLTGGTQHAEGTAKFIKSDKATFMRWDYLTPNRQILTSDGEMLRMYFAQLRQLIITPAKNLESDITYTFFTGKESFAKNFFLAPADSRMEKEVGKREGERILKLIPRKEQAQIQDVHIWISSDAFITKIKIQDHFGTVTTLSFFDIVANALEDSLENLEQFQFTPPPGTEIVTQ